MIMNKVNNKSAKAAPRNADNRDFIYRSKFTSTFDFCWAISQFNTR